MKLYDTSTEGTANKCPGPEFHQIECVYDIFAILVQLDRTKKWVNFQLKVGFSAQCCHLGFS
jgi:hypothetical protein